MSHWYTQEGKPYHWIEMANGKQRDTTLRDARKLNLVPSVTTILGTIDKPALNRWKETQILLAAMTLPKIEGESVDDFSKRVMKDAFKESTEARDRGSEIHNAIEVFFSTQIGDPWAEGLDADIRTIALEAAHAILDYCDMTVGDHNFTAEATVCGGSYGGMVDLHNDDFVIDYKTKDIKDVTKRMAYDEHAMQLAAYERALGGRSYRRCINVFVDRTEPGKVVIHEWKPEEIELAWEKFQLLVKYWQLSKGYVPEAA